MSKRGISRRGNSAVLLSVLILFLLTSGLFAQSVPDEELTEAVPFWRQALGGAMIGPPVAQVESVVVATDGGSLKSYSSQGRPLWDYSVRGRLSPFISRSREGTTYLGRTNGILVAVNRAGRELWQFDLKSPLVSPVLIGWDGRLFVFTERQITCMTAAGYVLWSRALRTNSVLAPIKDAAGGIILVQEDGEILNIDAFGSAFSYSAGTVPAAVVSLEAPASPAILIFYEDRRVESVNTAGGGMRREGLQLPSPPLAAVGRGSEAAVLLRDGRVAFIAEREIRWIAQSHLRAGELPARPGPLDLNFSFDDRGIYVLTKSGATGFMPGGNTGGNRLWFVRLRGAAALPSLGDDGVLYSGGIDWILTSYRLEEHVRARQRLIYGELPEGNYGTGNPGPSSWADYHFRFEEARVEARFETIRRLINEGAVGAAEKEYASWLMEISGGLLPNPPWTRGPSSSPPHVRHRVEAAGLLSYIGSRETIPFLTTLFVSDPDALVRAAAAEAIGKIGVDPEGLALSAFANAVLPPSPLRNENVLTAIAQATGALCRFSGPPLSTTGVMLLTVIAANNDFPVAQRQAQQEIRSIAR